MDEIEIYILFYCDFIDGVNDCINGLFNIENVSEEYLFGYSQEYCNQEIISRGDI